MLLLVKGQVFKYFHEKSIEGARIIYLFYLHRWNQEKNTEQIQVTFDHKTTVHAHIA